MNVFVQGSVLLLILIFLVVQLIYALVKFFVEEWEHMDDDEDMYIRRK